MAAASRLLLSASRRPGFSGFTGHDRVATVVVMVLGAVT